jgi:arginyl-tRNA synthetase
MAAAPRAPFEIIQCRVAAAANTRTTQSSMNLLAEIRARFQPAIQALGVEAAAAEDQVRRSQDAKFGDYQANCAMPLGKQLGRPPKDVAAALVERLDVADLCQPPEIAGPGFINLRLRDEWLASQLMTLGRDDRLGVPLAARTKTYVIDYSAPNVAKPMHVGHIRSTVIGDSLYRTLAFLGHRVVGDNHIGDWGTQFGMILYGYKNFRNQAAYEQDAVHELARLYRLVNRLVEYHEGVAERPRLAAQLAAREEELRAQAARPAPAEAKAAKEHGKAVGKLQAAVKTDRDALSALDGKLAAIDNDPHLSRLAAEHPTIGTAVLAETAKLHSGDAENVRLWREFLPPCLTDIERIYQRLGVRFDHTLGESFYHDRLAAVVHDLLARGIAQETAGAVGVFLPGHDTPFLVRKQDGAFLYGTSDLATIQYRAETWRPDSVLYVVDHRQSLHFEQLFAAARLWGYTDIDFRHVSFGTVLGEDGRPFKTRAGDTVGLGGLLDEAISRAYAIVCANDDAKPNGRELSDADRTRIAEVVGIAALKYADLSQNRTSDYTFSYDKMLAMNGNTATYMQYAYARVRSIFHRGGIDSAALWDGGATLQLQQPTERALGLEILRFAEALDLVVADYRPNLLTTYLFDLANRYSSFYDECPVLKADDLATRDSRLRLCDLTARVLAKGLELLGIAVVERM